MDTTLVKYYHFLPLIPHIPFNHPFLFSSISPLLISALFFPPFTLILLFPSFFPSPSAPDQGEAICSSNPSLILAQRSWKMYSRQTVGRCRLALGPQQEPGSALMEHYFQPLHPSTPPVHIHLLPPSLPPSFHLFHYSPILKQTICLSIYLRYFWKCSSPHSLSLKQKP